MEIPVKKINLTTMKIIYFLTISMFSILPGSCNQQNQEANHAEKLVRNTEAREDSIKLDLALKLQSQIEYSTFADLETDEVQAGISDDAADDPAIWLNKKNPAKSIVLGTNKKGGFYAFDLNGKILAYIKAGKINNIDLRDGFNYCGHEVVLVAGSNRSINAISLFYIDKDTYTISDTILNIKSSLSEIYGICMYHHIKSDEYFIIANGKNGDFEQWMVYCENNEKLKYKLSRKFKVNSQPEGIVADDSTNILYLGVEEEGIYKTGAYPSEKIEINKLAQSDSSNPNIAYDIEGLAVFKYNNKNFLMASIQGSFSYAIFELGDNDRYVGSFTIGSGHLDGVEETDGLEVIVSDIIPGFSGGLVVVQDGFNYEGNKLKSQNFKFVAFRKIQVLLDKSTLRM